MHNNNRLGNMTQGGYYLYSLKKVALRIALLATFLLSCI